MRNKKFSILAVFVITLIISAIALWIFNNLAFNSGLCACEGSCGGTGLNFALCDCYCIYFFGIRIPSNYSDIAIIATYFIRYILPILIAIVSTVWFSKKYAQIINKRQ